MVLMWRRAEDHWCQVRRRERLGERWLLQRALKDMFTDRWEVEGFQADEYGQTTGGKKLRGKDDGTL